MQREEVSGILTKKFWWKFCTVTPAFVHLVWIFVQHYTVYTSAVKAEGVLRTVA